MAGEVVQREKSSGKKGLRRPKRRLAIRIDMTPMVDIAFLLLIFYMVSTVFAMPQAMELNLPPKDDLNEPIEVKESNLLTLRVGPEGRYWWNLKTETPTNLPQLLPSAPLSGDTVVYKLNSDTLQGLLIAQNRLNPKLNTLILIHRDANYDDMVNILDEIDLIERSWNNYTMKELGLKDFRDVPRDRRFSYRYAIGDWEDRDDKVLSEAMLAAQNRGEL